jgi:hypothetical protein
MATLHPIPDKSSFKNMTGERYGRLLVVGYCGRAPGGARWLCRCDCGRETVVRRGSLTSGRTTSCDCLRVERAIAANTKHGHAYRENRGSPEYKARHNIISRCHNPNTPRFADYGGRGITVCERWRESFENFLADMGLRPSPRHSIDRIDNGGNYEPGNCRWATRWEQMTNRRNNRLLTCHGKTQCLSAWAREVGISVNSLRGRLDAGWPLERALFIPQRG